MDVCILQILLFVHAVVITIAQSSYFLPVFRINADNIHFINVENLTKMTSIH